MSELAVGPDDRVSNMCAGLGEQGFTQLAVRQYESNGALVQAITASGDMGDGPVEVTAIQEGAYGTYMMQRLAPVGGRANGECRNPDCMGSAYQSVGRGLLGLLASRPDVGVFDLSASAATTAAV